MRTNAARLLEQLGIPFELREYDVDPDALDASLPMSNRWIQLFGRAPHALRQATHGAKLLRSVYSLLRWTPM
jgi:prolyl-tRNA editing enzyme YbaK/EbsC (Cys-tRNA(Pro) deacylase)